MVTLDYCKRFARYNRWQNESIYAAAARLPDGTRKRNMGAFFKGIHGTLNHLLVADWAWMSRFDGEPSGVTSLDQELYSDFDELTRARVGTDNRIDRYVSSLTETTLAGSLTYRKVSGNQAVVTVPMADAIAHMFNHQTHHRGQVTTLLMQCGVDPGVTDLLALPAEFASPVFRL